MSTTVSFRTVSDLQQIAVALTRKRVYSEACLLHQIVERLAPEGEMKYTNRRDWCDALRRLGNTRHAHELVTSSIEFFQHQCNDAERAASLHHRARLHRQLGNSASAVADIQQAHDLLRYHNAQERQAGRPIHNDELYTELDRAAILAIAGHPKEAKQAARRALELVEEVGESQAHRRRAKVLYWFARWPRLPIKPVRYAFWGKTP